MSFSTDPTEQSMALAAINDAQMALERAGEIVEILDLRDKAAALYLFADAQGLEEAAQRAKIFQLQAERKAGLWLSENIGKGHDVRWHHATALPDGIDKNKSSRWQLQASVPEDRFQEWIDDCLKNNREITSAGLRGLARNHPSSAKPTFETLQARLVDALTGILNNYPERVAELLRTIRAYIDGEPGLRD